MGMGRREWEEYMERGWSAPEDKFVCTDCVEDDFLKDIISTNLAKRKCDYCGKGSRGYIAAPVEVIMEPIASALFYYYNDPDSAGMPYDGGWTFDVNITTENALAGIPLECHDDLLEDIAGSFENGLWVEAAGGHWASSHLSKIMAFFWQRFVQTVKHESRFFFSNSLSTSHSYDEFPPTKILAAIGKIVIDLGLVHPIIKKTKLFRVRERSSGAAWELDADQLGPPPKENAQSQRMNPAGISYFYLTKERTIALAEVLPKPPCRAAVGSFEVCRDLLIVDLSQLPEVPLYLTVAATAKGK